jgi:hypothetical protein
MLLPMISEFTPELHHSPLMLDMICILQRHRVGQGGSHSPHTTYYPSYRQLIQPGYWHPSSDHVSLQMRAHHDITMITYTNLNLSHLAF